MKKGKENQWKEAAERLQVDPSARVWDRLEARLDQDQGKVAVSRVYWWMSIAAGLFILVVIVTLLYMDVKETNRTLVVNDLEVPSARASLATYHYASDINGYYQAETWKRIDEGRHKPLMTRQHLNVAPKLDSVEDSL